MKIEDYIGEFANAVPDSLCDYVIEKFEQISTISTTHSGEVEYGSAKRRRDSALFFESCDGDLARQIHQHIAVALEQYIAHFAGLQETSMISHNVKVQKTEPGGGYHAWHFEQGPFGTNSAARSLVWTLYLNNVPAECGGETEFLHQKRRISPSKGTICLFPAAWTHTHRGNLLLDGVKYIATGWYFLDA